MNACARMLRSSRRTDLALVLEYPKAAFDVGQTLVARDDLGGSASELVTASSCRRAIEPFEILTLLLVERELEQVVAQVDLDQVRQTRVLDRVVEPRPWRRNPTVAARVGACHHPARRAFLPTARQASRARRVADRADACVAVRSPGRRPPRVGIEKSQDFLESTPQTVDSPLVRHQEPRETNQNLSTLGSP